MLTGKPAEEILKASGDRPGRLDRDEQPRELRRPEVLLWRHDRTRLARDHDSGSRHAGARYRSSGPGAAPAAAPPRPGADRLHGSDQPAARRGPRDCRLGSATTVLLTHVVEPLWFRDGGAAGAAQHRQRTAASRRAVPDGRRKSVAAGAQGRAAHRVRRSRGGDCQDRDRSRCRADRDGPPRVATERTAHGIGDVSGVVPRADARAGAAADGCSRRPSRSSAEKLWSRPVVIRASVHVEPRGALQIARHYVREIVYGANDGIITTFAVVAGVAGRRAVGPGRPDLRRRESAGRRALDGCRQLPLHSLPRERARDRGPSRRGSVSSPARGGDVLAFVVAGALPLLPYLVPGTAESRFTSAIVLAFAAMFAIGAARSLIANVSWWRAGAEMLGLGAVVTAVAYGSGALVARLLGLSINGPCHAPGASPTVPGPRGINPRLTQRHAGARRKMWRCGPSGPHAVPFSTTLSRNLADRPGHHER